jgi:hypothetical protein
MKVTHTMWFNTPHGDTIGIVMGEANQTKELRAYIGLGDGVNEEADKKKIAESGCPFPIETAKYLFKVDRK